MSLAVPGSHSSIPTRYRVLVIRQAHTLIIRTHSIFDFLLVCGPTISPKGIDTYNHHTSFKKQNKKKSGSTEIIASSPSSSFYPFSSSPSGQKRMTSPSWHGTEAGVPFVWCTACACGAQPRPPKGPHWQHRELGMSGAPVPRGSAAWNSTEGGAC